MKRFGDRFLAWASAAGTMAVSLGALEYVGHLGWPANVTQCTKTAKCCMMPGCWLESCAFGSHLGTVSRQLGERERETETNQEGTNNRSKDSLLSGSAKVLTSDLGLQGFAP